MTGKSHLFLLIISKNVWLVWKKR